ncbi:MAG: GGDEF and EAL domain-containing protein [Pseudomonadota bacterium]
MGFVRGDDNAMACALQDVGAAVFCWRADDDSIVWSGNIEKLLSLSSDAEVSSSQFYHQRLCEDGELLRLQAIEGARRSASGRRNYRAHYKFVFGSEDRDEIVWVEENGRCAINEAGEITHVNGMIRLVEDPRAAGAFSAQFETDDLTGFHARDFFIKLLDLLITDTKRDKKQATFYVAGIDNLKIINEAFGFEVADQVIGALAQRISTCLRKNDLIGRLAGNKFGLCLRNCGPDRAEFAAERMLEAVNSDPVTTSAGEVKATVSIGGVVVPRYARSSERAISSALEALSETREKRRAGFQLYEPSAQRDADRRLNVEIANDLIGALSEARLHLALQPVVRASNCEPAFHECLARILTRDGSIITAGGFMGFADRLGLVQLIDKRMLDLAVQLLSRETDIALSINVGVPSIADLEWFNQLAHHALRDKTMARRLIVEITETEAIKDVEGTKTFVESMHDLGCRVALDDLGAGFTSYRNLRDLGVDMVKIDGSFMSNLDSHEPDQMFVRTLIALAKSMDIETVAEWVETQKDADLLREWGIDYMQGHLFGTAVMREKANPTKVIDGAIATDLTAAPPANAKSAC